MNIQNVGLRGIRMSPRTNAPCIQNTHAVTKQTMDTPMICVCKTGKKTKLQRKEKNQSSKGKNEKKREIISHHTTFTTMINWKNGPFCCEVDQPPPTLV